MASALENSHQRKARAQSCPRPKHFPGDNDSGVDESTQEKVSRKNINIFFFIFQSSFDIHHNNKRS